MGFHLSQLYPSPLGYSPHLRQNLYPSGGVYKAHIIYMINRLRQWTSISRDMVSATKGRQSRTPNKWKPSKMGKKRQWPLWPWIWPYDLGVIGVCRPCLYPPTILIWWWSEIIKAVKCVFQGLTLKGQYLTLRAKKSKFRRINFLRMAPKNIPRCFQHSPIKTVGGVRENA